VRRWRGEVLDVGLSGEPRGLFRSRQKIGRWTGVTRLRDCERPELEPKEVVDSSIAGMVAKSMRMQAIINN
jgi:hypothetical protein